LSQLEGGNSAYNIVTALYLKGTIHKEAFHQAFRTLIQRHESLRTVFHVAGEEPRQIVLDRLDPDLEFEDIQQCAHVKDLLKAETGAFRNWKFDLENGPLIRVKLLQLAAQEYALIFGVHHIVCDGWSTAIIVREVLSGLGTYLREQSSYTPSLPIQYKDYTFWQARRMTETKRQDAANFWKDQFPTAVEPLHLPIDVARTAARSFEGAVAKFYWESGLYDRIIDLCKKFRATPFNFFRSALAVLLNKFSGQRDMVIGTPVSGRDHYDLEDQVGLYVNTLPLRTVIDPEDPFPELLKKISEHSFRAFAFQDYPFESIVEDLAIQRDLSRNPLFDVMLVLHDMKPGAGNDAADTPYGFEWSRLDTWLNASARADWFRTAGDDLLRSAGAQYTGTEHERISAKFDLCFSIGRDPGDQYYLEIEYAAGLFNDSSINRLFNAFQYIISQILDCPDIVPGAIETVSVSERHLLLESFNNTGEDYPKEGTVLSLLEEQVERVPDKIAVVGEGGRLSYRELGIWSDRLGHYLRDRYEVKPEELIGVQLRRSEWMIIALVGVWKAGGAYVPIDPSYPAERIAWLKADSRCRVVIDEEEMERFEQCAGEYDGDRAGWRAEGNMPVVRAGHLAYVIYTSGSTGLPKGVMIEHRNVNAFIHWCRKEFLGEEVDIVYGVTSICFDLSVFEIFYTLCSGKTLRILANALSIGNYIKGDKNILLNTVPGVVGALQREQVDLTEVKVLNMAGEAIPSGCISLVDCGRTAVRNLYGPSETTTYSTVYRIGPDRKVLIGRPIGNTGVYIVNEELQLQPVGVWGEICIGGDGVARGYLNNASLTEEKFIANPLRTGDRVYRTGDIGRWLADGTIELSGRKDEQVKIRGFRIEPGEIARVLQDHEEIEEAVVVKGTDAGGEVVLIAYLVGRRKLGNGEVREYLAKRLPAYMLPGYYVQLSSLPLTMNGKLDRKQLPDPAGIWLETATEYVAPRNEIEAELAVLWSEVLGIEPAMIGVKDNFFNLGGHSLKAAQLISRINSHFLIRINIQTIFSEPTIESISGQIDFILAQTARKVNKEKLVKIEL
jgi:amino acid adenylation domain-containing protein